MHRRKPAVARRANVPTGDPIADRSLQGRGGEALPPGEQTALGHRRDWQRDDAVTKENDEPRSWRRLRAGPGRKQGTMEIEYERGPGSKFQTEGRGGKPLRQARPRPARRARRSK